MDQAITYSMARIKLRKRHLLESDKLAANQHMVLELIREETDKKLIDCRDDKRACIDLTLKQTTRRIDLLARQQEERAKMKARHRQETSSLEQAFETHEVSSN